MLLINIYLLIVAISQGEVVEAMVFDSVLKFVNEDVQYFQSQTLHNTLKVNLGIVEKDEGDRKLSRISMLEYHITRI
jgi:hypothetical protein